MTDEPRRRRPLAAVYTLNDAAAWLVAETPSEVADRVRASLRSGDAADGLIALTLATPSPGWNGRTVYLDANLVAAISPPVDPTDHDDHGDDDD